MAKYATLLVEGINTKGQTREGPGEKKSSPIIISGEDENVCSGNQQIDSSY
jgi:hypothetical protein